jgi:hypothetical protein
MSDANDEVTLDISIQDLDELLAVCAKEGINVEVDRDQATRSTFIENLETVYTLAGIAGGTWTAYNQAPARFRAQISKVAWLDQRFDRKAGGHVIYTNEHSHFADARTPDLEYGYLRVVGATQMLDIDASEVIKDTPTRVAFAKRVKKQLGYTTDLEEVGAEVVTWDGVVGAEIEDVGLRRPITKA